MSIIKHHHKYRLIYNDANVLHSISEPAVKGSDCECWFMNGLIHRDHGPAIQYFDEDIWSIDFEISSFKMDEVHLIHSQPFDKDYWYVHGINLTSSIIEWLQENKITYPFSESDLILFKMRWL